MSNTEFETSQLSHATADHHVIAMDALTEEGNIKALGRVDTANSDKIESALNPANQRGHLPPPPLYESWSGEIPMHEVFERMGIEQRRFFELVAKNLNFDTEEDISLIAERLWNKPEDAWNLSKAAVNARLDRSLGREFLNSLLPWGTSLAQFSGKTELVPNIRFAWRITGSSKEVQWFAKPNLETAYDIFKEWLTTPDLYSLPWDNRFLAKPNQSKESLYIETERWPKSWTPNHHGRALGNEREVNYSTNRGTFDDLLDYQTQIFDTGEAMKVRRHPFRMVYDSKANFKRLKDLGVDSPDECTICGVIGRISIDRAHGILDHETIATILCLGQGPKFWPYGGPQFLHAHIAEWSVKPLHATCRTRIFQSATCEITSNSLNPGSHRYGVFMHYMRSFTVVDEFIDNSKAERHPPPGLKCSREWISFQGFYGQGTLKLAERRYSTTLSMLPILRPLGHYVLLSLIDTDQRTKDQDRNVWRGSPAFYDPVTNRTSPWKRYGLFPAGIYTGMAVFQLQICAFIDSWEADWNDTIDHVDGMVSAKLHTLRDVHRLKTLILDSKAEKSVLYFQVLQILRLFSDSVRAAPGSLETLSHNVRKPASKDYWFEQSYPHTKDTQRVLEHNWKIVTYRQREASEKLLIRLERTANEVKSLRDGLFSAQSVAEAQKTRLLSKYLFVFTIVTIFFLPPTFVATVFGMDMFESSSQDTTKTRFWAVMVGISGTTYLIAALGLFGTSISSEDWEQWVGNVKQMQWVRRKQSTAGSQFCQDYSEPDKYYAQ